MNRKELSRRMNEIRLRRLELIAGGENENNALNIARKEANDKYGKGWREELLMNVSSASKVKEPSVYEGHVNGEHWMD